MTGVTVSSGNLSKPYVLVNTVMIEWCADQKLWKLLKQIFSV